MQLADLVATIPGAPAKSSAAIPESIASPRHTRTKEIGRRFPVVAFTVVAVTLRATVPVKTSQRSLGGAGADPNAEGHLSSAQGAFLPGQTDVGVVVGCQVVPSSGSDAFDDRRVATRLIHTYDEVAVF